MLELKIMDIGAIFDKSFRMIFNKNFLKIIGLMLILTFIANLSQILIIRIFYPNYLTLLNPMNNWGNITSNPAILIIISIIFLLIIFIVYAFFSALSMDLFKKLFLQKEWTLRSSIKEIKNKIHKIFLFFLLMIVIFFVIMFFYTIAITIISGLLGAVLSLISPVLVIIAMIIFIIAYLFMAAIIISLFSLAIPIIIVEGKNMIDSVMRSMKLVGHSFWRIVGTITLLLCILFFLFIILLLIFGIFTAIYFAIINNDTKTNLISNVNILSVITIIFNIIISLLFYFILGLVLSFVLLIFYNQKIKIENYGIEFLAETMISESLENDEKKTFEKTDINKNKKNNL